jgi:hypothetical protein
MKRRFTDICKWDDPWFMELSPELKILWLFVLDNCDHAGIWNVNTRLAEFKMGVIPTWGEGLGRVPEAFKERVEVSPRKGDYWFIPKFLKHQYGEKLNKGDAFRSAFEVIESKGFLESLRRVYGESVDSLGRVKAKAKAKATAIASSKEGESEGERRKQFVPPTVEEVAAYCAERKNGIDAEKFVSHYAASGWMRGKTKIKDWKACISTWERSGYSNDKKAEAIPSWEIAQPKTR